MSEQLFSRDSRDGSEILYLIPYVLAGPTHGATTRYEILNRETLQIFKRLSGGTRAVRISDVTDIQVEKPNLMKRPLNYGTLIFRVSGEPKSDAFCWENVNSPESVKRFILSLNTDEHNGEKQKTDESQSRFPHDTVFSENILMLPGISEVFDRPLWEQHCRPGLHPKEHVGYGDWVNRGDVLCSFPIGTSWLRNLFDSKTVSVGIASPVSGLMLQTTWIFGRPWTTILLPEGEPEPLPSAKIFGPLCEFCYQHRSYIFGIPRGEQGVELQDAFKIQLSSEYTYIHVSEAQDYINELRSVRSDLREHLAHLVMPLSQPNTTAQGQKTKDDPASEIIEDSANVTSINSVSSSNYAGETQEQASDDIEASASSLEKRDDADVTVWTNIHDHAMSRLGIALPFTRAELGQRYGECIREALDRNEVEQAKQDCNMLIPFAI